MTAAAPEPGYATPPEARETRAGYDLGCLTTLLVLGRVDLACDTLRGLDRREPAVVLDVQKLVTSEALRTFLQEASWRA